jgi:hypothetical protein
VHLPLSLPVLIALCTVSWASPLCASFIYPNFSSPSDFALGGAAVTIDGVLRLTPDRQYQTGNAWFTEQQNVADGFSTTFVFQLSAAGPIADGLWFVVQNDSLQMKGFFDGAPNSIAVEFDTYKNVWDPNANHLAIQSCGANPNTTRHDTGCTLASNDVLPVTLADGRPHTATVTYVPGNMAILLDGIPSLSTSVDLSGLLNLNAGRAWVGFMTSTGEYSENNDVLDWSFTDAPEPSTPAMVLIGLILAAGIANKMKRCGRAAERLVYAQKHDFEDFRP